MEWMRAQLWEIEKSKSLRIFGGLLALTHTLTFVYWQLMGRLPLQFYNETPLCWSIFENCMSMRIIPVSVFTFLYYFYFVLSLIVAGVFFLTRSAVVSWWLLTVLLSIKTFFYFQDLRLSSNVHYFLFCLQLIYLFVPNKEGVLKAYIASFYVASGLVKMSPDWLTGQWFIQHGIANIKLAEWMAALTIVIEMIASVALLFKRGRYFWVGLLVLFFYHSILWWKDSFFPASAHMIALTLFVFLHFEEQSFETENLYQFYLRPQPSRVWIYVALVAFWLTQLTPRLGLHQSRWKQALEFLAIERPAASQECRLVVFAKFTDHVEQIEVPEPALRPVQQKCSPYFRFLDLKQTCTDLSRKAGFLTLSTYMETRGQREAEYHSAFEIDDFCSSKIHFRDLGVVSWNTTPTDK